MRIVYATPYHLLGTATHRPQFLFLLLSLSSVTALRFSFWIANNAPFSQRRKIALLEMNSTVERLEFVLRRLRNLTARECPISCRRCSIGMTTSGQIFTVEGAEGTTSTYVNEHGSIHQVMTVRSVDETFIAFQGRASIENTYFPGYCWLIAYCTNCGSHLGWKFQKVDGSPNKANRPSTFWGFMSSSVSTIHNFVEV